MQIDGVHIVMLSFQSFKDHADDLGGSGEPPGSLLLSLNHLLPILENLLLQLLHSFLNALLGAWRHQLASLCCEIPLLRRGDPSLNVRPACLSGSLLLHTINQD